MKIEIKRLDATAVIPTYATEKSFCSPNARLLHRALFVVI